MFEALGESSLKGMVLMALAIKLLVCFGETYFLAFFINFSRFKLLKSFGSTFSEMISFLLGGLGGLVTTNPLGESDNNCCFLILTN